MTTCIFVTVTVITTLIAMLITTAATVLKAYELEAYLKQIEETSPQIYNEAINACTNTTTNKAVTEKVLCAMFLKETYSQLKQYQQYQQQYQQEIAKQEAELAAQNLPQTPEEAQQRITSEQFQQQFSELKQQTQTETSRPYCDQLEPGNRTGVVCHDRYDASDVTGLYTCRNGTHSTDPLACR